MEDEKLLKIFRIWDLNEKPEDYADQLILWRSYGNNDNCISIPQLVEDNYKELRKRFTTWVYNVGNLSINGIAVKDQLQIRKDLSFWWLTEFGEMQHYGKTPQIYDAVRLIALENFLNNNSGQFTIIFSTDCNIIVSNILLNWCKKRGIKFVLDFHGDPKKTIDSVTRMEGKNIWLPDIFKAFGHLLKYVKSKTIFKKVPKVENEGTVTIFDYLIDVNKSFEFNKTYNSNYWTVFESIFHEKGIKLNWMHYILLTGSNKQESYESHIIKISKFNNSNLIKGDSHNVFNSQLSFKILFRTILDYTKLYIKSFSVIKIKNRLFLFDDSDFDFSPLFFRAFKRTIRGGYAMSQIILLNLLEDKLKKMPKQEIGFYLQENMAWENSLLYAWRNGGHGKIVGVPHVTVRKWDLRYFGVPESHNGNSPKPKPDIVALNSQTAISEYYENGYPPAEIVSVEALRYLYLNNLSKENHNNQTTSKLNVLILGDYLIDNVKKQLQWIVEAVSDMNNERIKFLFKPHPVTNIDLSLYRNEYLLIEETSESFESLSSICNLAFATNVTSAIVDAYSSGMKVISMLDGETFNMSPLSGNSEVVYVRNVQELRAALSQNITFKKVKTQPFFNTNPELKGWKKLIYENYIN